MPTLLFVGGFKHGVLEQTAIPVTQKFVYEFPKSPNNVTGPEVFYQVVYLPIGTWYSHYGAIEVYAESTTHFVSKEVSNAMLYFIHEDPQAVYVLDVNHAKDSSICLLDANAKMFAGYGLTDSGILVPQGVLPPADYMGKVAHPLSVATLNETLKKTYSDIIKQQMVDKFEILKYMEYNSPALQSYEYTQAGKWTVVDNDRRAWLNAGLRDYNRVNLCFWCAEELVGPGAGMQNDFIVPKGRGSRVRKLVCGNCGRGKFNRKGERVGDWLHATAMTGDD